MGRLADKWARKMKVSFKDAIESAQAVTAEEYAAAIAIKLAEESGKKVSASDILTSTPIKKYVSEIGAFDVDKFLKAVDWAALAGKWSKNWLGAYGIKA